MQENDYALIFYTLDTQRCTMRLTHEAYSHLEYIWAQYKTRLGYYPDQYGGHPLKLAQIRILLQIIDHYTATADLNANREATKTILSLRGMLQLALEENTPLQLWWA